MSTGFDVSAESMVAQLSETVERGASLLAGGTRLAGPAGVQDTSAELVPGDAGSCVGVGLVFNDGTAATAVLTHALALELCGGIGADQVLAGLQVVSEQLAGGASLTVLESAFLADGASIDGFLAGRTVLVGAGIFEGDAIVATVGAAGAVGVGAAPGVSPGPSPAAPSVSGAPASANAALPTSAGANSAVSDAVLARGLALLADVHLELTVELGRAHLRVSDLLGLEPGSVIDLDREAGSPVDLLVNGTLFARAEVIVVENNYAVRITELVAKGITP